VDGDNSRPTADTLAVMETDLTQWSPRPAETAVAILTGLVVLGLAVLADPAGRILLGVAALGLLTVGAATCCCGPDWPPTAPASRSAPWPAGTGCRGRRSSGSLSTSTPGTD